VGEEGAVETKAKRWARAHLSTTTGDSESMSSQSPMSLDAMTKAKFRSWRRT
jgi:hypothetical protein